LARVAIQLAGAWSSDDPQAAPGMTVWQATRRLSGRVLRAEGPAFALLQTILTQPLVALLNMASGIMTARILGAEGRGIFTALTVWPQFLAYTSFVGLPVAFVYYLKEAPDQRGSILTSAMTLAALLSSAAVAVGIIVVPFYMPNFSPETVFLAQLCVLGTYGQFLNTMCRQAMVGLGLFTAFNLSSYLAPFLYVASMAVVWATVGLTPGNSAACLLLTMLVTDIWMGWRILRICRPRLGPIRRWMRNLLSYSARASINDVVAGLMSNIDRLVLILFITPGALGDYAVAYSFSRQIQLLQVGANMVLFPSMAGRPLAEVKVLHDHALRLMAYAVVIAVAAFLVIGPRLLALLYGPDFAGIAILCDVLVVEAGLSNICVVIVQLYMSTGNPGYVSFTQAACFATAMAFMLLLAPSFGGIGAAIGLLISTIVRLILLWAGIALRLRIDLPRLHPIRSDLTYLRNRFSG